MTDRLDKLEANIGEKEEEAARLEEKLTALRNDYATKAGEFQKAQAELAKLESEIASRKEAGSSGAGEVEKLEEDLMHQTQKVKVMATISRRRNRRFHRWNNQESVMFRQQPAPAARGPVMPKLPPTRRGRTRPRSENGETEKGTATIAARSQEEIAWKLRNAGGQGLRFRHPQITFFDLLHHAAQGLEKTGVFGLFGAAGGHDRKPGLERSALVPGQTSREPAFAVAVFSEL